MNVRKWSALVLMVVVVAMLAACAAPTAAPTSAPPATAKAPAAEPTKAPAASTEKLSFSIATGGTGGVWYPLGGAISGVIAKNVPNTDASVEATTAALDNLKLLTANKSRMSFAYDYHGVWVNKGTMPGLTGAHKIRAVLSFYEQPLHIVTKEGTNVKAVTDLKGKRVSTGAPNSGTEEQADYVFKALGMDWSKDLTREKLGATESVAALRDGKIDAFFWSGAVPTASIIDLASTPGLKMVLLPVSGDAADKIMKGNPGVFHKTTFPKGSYSSVDADIDTLAITAVLYVMDSFPEDRLYQILKAMFDNKSDLTAVAKEVTKLTPELAVKQMSPDAQEYLHPGAKKYFVEKGVIK
ncbi:MAG: TAXI family TRAP transporter solute-binding subunit [Chloroflexi bacterium]|nr:TAXI family TRAP transporter solute-binding subunit [Chloroflexota bacterium]